jgi:hypothetical protein
VGKVGPWNLRYWVQAGNGSAMLVALTATTLAFEGPKACELLSA